MTTQKLGKKETEVGPNDVMISKFQAAMSKFEVIMVRIKDFEEAISNLSEKATEASKNHQDLSDLVQRLSAKVDVTAGALDSKLVALKDYAQNVSEQHSIFAQKTTRLQNDITSLIDAQDFLEKSISGKPAMTSFVELASELTKVKDMLKANSSEFVDLIKGVNTTQQKLQSQLSEISGELPRQKAVIADLQAEKNKAVDTVKAVDGKIGNEVAACKTYVDAQLKSKIDALPKPVIPTQADIVKAIEDRFEPVRLDASNAKLKAGNNDVKLTLLEKKIEQLQLLVSQLQLQKQG